MILKYDNRKKKKKKHQPRNLPMILHRHLLLKRNWKNFSSSPQTRTEMIIILCTRLKGREYKFDSRRLLCAIGISRFPFPYIHLEQESCLQTQREQILL